MYDVCLSHVEHPGKFFVHLIEEAVELDQLMVKLTTEYNSCQPMSGARVGTCCIAKLSDNQHYRSLLLSFGGSYALVEAVDFGFEERVEVNTLRQLPLNMQSVPLYAAICTIDVTKAQERYWLIIFYCQKHAKVLGYKLLQH